MSSKERSGGIEAKSLAPEDLARLRMGVPQNSMVIVAALVLERPLAREALSTLLETRLLRHERFRSKVVEPPWASPQWTEVGTLDLREHCTWHPAGAGAPTLEKFVEARANEPLDRRRPLWHLDVREDIDGGAALVLRVHHVVADGEALVAILGELTDERMGTGALTSAPHPARTPRRVFRLLGGLDGAIRLALRSPDPSFAHRALGTTKRFSFSAPLSLARIAASAHISGGTVTEILLAAVATALRGHLISCGHPPDLPLHALVPVSLHAAADNMGNHFTSVFVRLPSGKLLADERVRAIASNLRAARSRGALRASAHLVGAASAVARAFERSAVMFFSRRASVVVSSVRGPSRAVHLEGVLVRDVLVWAPAPGEIPLAVTLMSYADRVRIGVSADALVIGDPTPIVRTLERELGGPAGRA